MNQRRFTGTFLGSLVALTCLVSPMGSAIAEPAGGGTPVKVAAADSVLSQAEAHLRAGRFAQARKLAEQALAKDSDSLRANLLMGQILDHVADFEGALSYFKKAVEKHPDSLEAEVWLGAGYLAAEKYDQAIAVSEKSIGKWEKKDPDKELFSRLWVNLAGAQGLKAKREGLLAMLRYGTAVRGNLQKAIGINENSRSQYALGRYYVEAPGAVGGDPKKGLPLLTKALQQEPHYHAIRAHYMRGLLAVGKTAEAKAEWERFKSDFGDYPAVLKTAKDVEAKL